MTRLETRAPSLSGPTVAREPYGPPDPDDPTPAAPRPAPASSSAPSDPLRKAAILIVSLEESLARQLLAHLDRADVDAISLEMARLDRIDPEEQQAVLEDFYAQGLKRLRFVFEDVLRLDDRDIRTAFDDEDAPTWALALAGATRPVRTRVIAALSAPSADLLRRTLAELGPTRLDDVESAQADLAERLRRLHDQARITLPDPDGQEELLV